MEQCFSKLFENIYYERSLILLLSLTDPDISRRSIFTDHEIDIRKQLALEKLHRLPLFKEEAASSLLELYFSI